MAPTPPPDSPDLDALAQRYADAVCAMSPVRATALGRHDADDRLGEPDPAAYAALARTISTIQRDAAPALESADPLIRADAHALNGMLATARLELEDEQQWRRNPDVAVETCLFGCFSLLLRDFAPLDQRVASLAGRLAAVPGYLDAASRLWSDVPAIWAETGAESARAGAAFLRTALSAAIAGASDTDRILRLAHDAADALDATAARIETAADAGAPWKLGEDLVGRRLRDEHHLSDTPATMERRGLALVEESLVLLNDLDSNWRDTLAQLKNAHPPGAGLVAAYRDEMERARRFVAQHNLAPATVAPLQVRPTPSFWAHLLPYAAYDPPGFFESDQTGIFWVTVPEGPDAADQLKGHFNHAITVTAIHEGFPGHHQQLTGANAAGNLLRCLADSSLTIEGWAFYCEQMFWEQGYYGDDTGLRIAQLKDQLWRAARVVLDMRLHCSDLTPDDAVSYLVDVADLETGNAAAEVRRYTSSPTYQISYAIGKAEILALRDAVAKIQGEQFDITAFHADLLRFGNMAVPLSAAAMLATLGSAT